MYEYFILGVYLITLVTFAILGYFIGYERGRKYPKRPSKRASIRKTRRIPYNV